MHSATKWFRKNNRKIMAVAVIIILFGLVGGSWLRSLAKKGNSITTQIAAFGDNEKISNYDLGIANQELKILKMLKVNQMLRSIPLPGSNSPDLRATLLGELLFADRTASPVLLNRLKQVSRVNQYNISNKQFYDIYERSAPTDLYWFLLTKEAQSAGVQVPREDSGKALASAIPQLFEGSTYVQLIGSILKNQSIPEEKILETFSKMLAVLEYSKMLCSVENTTNAQIKYDLSIEGETINIEFVKLDPATFTKKIKKPSKTEIAAQFETYKKYFPGQFDDQNPYGFGYKLPETAQLEYIAIKLEDVSKIITQPTDEQIEDFYKKNKPRFTEQVPTDPTDPNSPQVTRTRSFGEMRDAIKNQLRRNKIDAKADMIMLDARTLTESGLGDIDTETDEVDNDYFKQNAGDYKKAADELTKTYQIPMYTGQTGQLSASQFQNDEYLGAMYLGDYARGNIIGLTNIIFSIDQLATSQLGPFDPPKPRLYENIGPLKDVKAVSAIIDLTGQIMMVARIIDAKKAREPESLNETFSTKAIQFANDAKDADDKYSVKENVTEDLKKLTAMGITAQRAAQLIELAKEKDWPYALDRLNKLYGNSDKDETDPNTFELRQITSLQRFTKTSRKIIETQNQGNPTAQAILQNVEKENLLRETLYSIIPKDADTLTLEQLPKIFEFKADMTYYVIKDISVNRVYQQEYERAKAPKNFTNNLIETQSMAPIHFNPANILKRTNFNWLKETLPADPNSSDAPKEKS